MSARTSLLAAMLLAAMGVHAADKSADAPNKQEGVMKSTTGQGLLLFPMPQKMTAREGVLRLQGDRLILLKHDAPQLLRSGEIIQSALAAAGQRLELAASAGTNPARPGVIVSIKPDLAHGSESYRLTIGKERIEIEAQSATGAFRAAMTLKQIVRAGNGTLPCLAIEDWPDIPNRGAMLDISRDKVPTMETLYKLADTMAEFKMNQLQLYTEHTFAYRNHKDVWENASPMTADEIRKLDAYCGDRFIELVPNQNSFGHMGRWLGIKRYGMLAEDPGNPDTLCPTDPNAIKLLEEMYAELLPNFSSRQFNVGCDETDVGNGRSKAEADKIGVARVYLEFLLKIHGLVKKNGRTMQFWADIILQHPEQIPHLPKDIIALAWGYEADHPYADQCATFAKAGIPFYVCPGTSAWNALIGRTDNMRRNVVNAATNGATFGASGFLITSWGDGGHWDHLPVAYAGYTYGAAVSWAGKANKDIDLARAMDTYVFQDKAGVMGTLVLDLGNAYLESGVLLGNQTVLNYTLRAFDAPRSTDDVFKQVELKGIERTLAYLDRVMENLPKVKMEHHDAGLITAEFRNNAAMARHACLLDIARIKAGGDGDTKNLPAETRKELAADMKKIIADFKRLWLVRNREGGLTDSVSSMESLLRAYETN